MRVDVWTDLVCPWCYLGKRRFERGLAAFPHRDQVEVVHHSFQLDPSLPRGESVSQSEVLQEKYGLTEARAAEMQKQMERTAAAEGLEYHLVGGKTGNTFDAHRLLHLAKGHGGQDATIERLYRAHFTEQRSLFDRESLVELGKEAGLDPDEVRSVLETDRFSEAVAADLEKARILGIRGVPFFVIDDRYGISGAQPPELFAQALEQGWGQPSDPPG